MKKISIIFFNCLFLLTIISISICNAMEIEDDNNEDISLIVKTPNISIIEESSAKTEDTLDNKSSIRIQAISYIDHYIVGQEPILENGVKRFFRLATKIVGPILTGPITGIRLITASTQKWVKITNVIQ